MKFPHIPLAEGHKQGLLFFASDPWPCVTHRDRQRAIALSRRHLNAPITGELHRITNHVGQHLSQQLRIKLHGFFGFQMRFIAQRYSLLRGKCSKEQYFFSYQGIRMDPLHNHLL